MADEDQIKATRPAVKQIFESVRINRTKVVQVPANFPAGGTVTKSV